MISLDDFLNENVFYTYYIFDQWIPISLYRNVPLASFFPDVDNVGNCLELPPHILVDTFNGKVGFLIRNDTLTDHEYIEVDIMKRDDTILDFLAQAKFPKYTNEQIDASIPPDEFYHDIVE